MPRRHREPTPAQVEEQKRRLAYAEVALLLARCAEAITRVLAMGRDRM
jgi:hypothetical protein